jgi:multiple sugar transport system permease protein
MTRFLAKFFVYAVIIAGAVTMVFPFVWMISTSFKSSLEVLSSRISVVPELKKYIRSDGGWEPVEFQIALDLDRLVSESEGRFTTGVLSGPDAASAFKAEAASSYAALRGKIGKVYAVYQDRESVREKLGAAFSATLGKLESTISSLPPGAAGIARAELESLRSGLLSSDEKSADTPERIALVVLAGEKRGEKSSLPLGEIAWKRFLLDNFVKAWRAAPFARYFLNTIFVSLVVTVGQVLTSALAAYAFARMKFRFKEPLFLILLGTMMVPHEVILIPDYVIISKLGWMNTYNALIVPFLGAVFGTYFMRQHFETLPQDLFDAASIDGCGRLRTLFQLVLPLSRTVILTMALFTFIGTWNSLLWPLVMTNTPEMRPLQVGLAVFNQESGTEWELLMAASTFSILPLLLIFFIAQKQFIEGITRSGMKD